MKRYCFFLYNIDPGGLEVYLLRFFRHYQGEFEATLICKSGQTGTLLESYKETGVRVIPIRAGYLNPLAWYKIYRILLSEKFDAVCDLTSNFAGLYMLLAKWANIPSRVAYFGQSTNHFRESIIRLWYDRMINKLVYRHATAIVLNSHTALQNFFPYRSKEDQRFSVIYNGVNASIFHAEKDIEFKESLGIPKNAFVVGHTGRYDEKKNHPAVLALATLACALWPDCYFICCGKGTEQLQSDIDILGLSDRFKALGYRDDVHRVLQTMDVFYFPSYTEGQPNSLIEAMMSGLPFIASNIIPIKDTIPEQLYSQLVDPDDVQAAFALLKLLYNSSELRTALSCRPWAIESYNADDRFREFLESMNVSVNS